MYADPTKIRANEVKLRFNDQETQLIDALVNYTGEQKAVFIRELVLEGIKNRAANIHSTASQN